MKTLQTLSATVVLSLALALSAFAGDMSAPGATNPPSPQQSSARGDIGMPGATAMGDMGAPGATVTGDIQTPGVAELDAVTEFTLSLLQSMLSLF